MSESATKGRREDAVSLRIGGVCAIVGAIAFATVRVLHGDTPAADAQASLEFVAGRPWYAATHIGAVFAALLSLVGLIALVGSLIKPAALLFGRFGLATLLVGLAIFSVESTSEGLALPELARASAEAAAEQQSELVRAAHAVLAMTHGPSLVAIALLYGVAFVGFGSALVIDDYPSWLGWTGVGLGALTLIVATGEYLNPDLMPGFLIYGVLASILAPVWLVALSVVLLRRAGPPRA
jgi:hypothetical protein